MPTELESWIVLNKISAVGPVKFRKLIEHFGSGKNVLSATADDISVVEGIEKRTAETIFQESRRINPSAELELAAKNGVKIITAFMDEYPASLKTVYDYPHVLYVRGEFRPEDVFAVAFVGSRKNTIYGKSACEYLARDLAQAGITIVSGLARGIDTVAHRVALEAGGRTLAVLGNGLDRHYPPENRKLEDSIACAGALISEFPMEIKPDKQNFPRRNRLISGLSLGVVVIEAAESSGALITARTAAEQGKDVFAVPGSIFSKYSKGPNGLIKQGAKLVENAEDIINEINALKVLWDSFRSATNIVQQEDILDPDTRAIFDVIGFEPVHIDFISVKLGISIEKLSVILL